MKMNNENDNKTDRLIAELEKHIRETMPDNCVSYSLYFNATGYEVEAIIRSPEGLKNEGISMRNLRGEFIK